GKLKLADKQLASLAATGVNVTDVAKVMGMSAETLRGQLVAGTVDARKFGDALNQALVTKGAGPLARMSVGLDTLGAKLRENIEAFFEDVDTAPFLAAMKDLLGIFGQDTASGQTLKKIITGFFNETFKLAAKVLPYIKRFLLDLIIFGLKTYIGLKPL